MKKFLAVLLSGVTALSLFACANNTEPEPEQKNSGPNFWGCTPHDTFIQDGDGVHHCFWDDGKAIFDLSRNLGPSVAFSIKKNAVLSLHTEYDLWFAHSERNGSDDCIIDIAQYYLPLEYKYDRTKIEIEPNPDKENHFILRMLQPCENEEIAFTLTEAPHPPLVTTTFHFAITVGAPPLTVVE